MSDETGETDERDLEARVEELEARVEALHRKVNGSQPSDDGDSTSIPFQGAKRNVIERLEPGTVLTVEQLRGLQNNIGEQQRKKNAKMLMRSEFFEDAGIGKTRFVGIDH